MKTIELPTDDPLVMVRAIREKIYEETKDMNCEDFEKYLRESSDWFELEMSKRRTKQDK